MDLFVCQPFHMTHSRFFKIQSYDCVEAVEQSRAELCKIPHDKLEERSPILHILYSLQFTKQPGDKYT